MDNQMEKEALLLHDMEEEILHGMCVSKLAGYLARELNLNSEYCHKIEIAGVLHDVGKLRISNYINDREEDAMQIEQTRYARMHSSLGYDIVKRAGYDEEIAQMVLHHHENYDGSGYPGNLRGEDIPLGARILRVCDVFSALISDRPYRPAFSVEKAAELMTDEYRNFDMRIFLTFQSVIHSEKLLEEMQLTWQE